MTNSRWLTILPQKNQYVADLESTGDTFKVRAAFPSLTGWLRKLPDPLVPVPSLRQANAVEGRTMHYAHESLQWHRRLVEASPDATVPTLFSKLYHDRALPAREMAADAQAYIIGGSDTLSKTLTYLVWAVCRHPHVQQKLVREIRQRLPLPGQQRSGFTDAQVRELPYLALVIEETLRLYPAVPSALPRVVPPDAPELCGRRLPAGATVTTSAYCLHRDPAAFPEPERFWPERWQSPTRRMKDVFLAFGGGSRGELPTFGFWMLCPYCGAYRWLTPYEHSQCAWASISRGWRSGSRPQDSSTGFPMWRFLVWRG